jgi:hypothetical protein
MSTNGKPIKDPRFHRYYDAAQYRTDKWNELKLLTMRASPRRAIA